MNIWVTTRLSLGPLFRMIFGVWPTGCYRVDIEMPAPLEDIHREDCDDINDIYNAGAPEDLPHLWSVGIVMSYIFE